MWSLTYTPNEVRGLAGWHITHLCSLEGKENHKFDLDLRGESRRSAKRLQREQDDNVTKDVPAWHLAKGCPAVFSKLPDNLKKPNRLGP